MLQRSVVWRTDRCHRALPRPASLLCTNAARGVRAKRSVATSSANINRYNLWPDPLLNPRTVREEVDGEFRTELFCPVPQMVGGGTVHWQGWLPRFTEEDFKLHSVVGDVPGTTLVDWPISYDDLESYYAQIEWAFGVSGGLAPTAMSPGAARTIRARRCPNPGTRRNSIRAAQSLATTRSPLHKLRCLGLSTDGRRR